MKTSCKYVPISYAELESTLIPSFTVGAAYEHFGKPEIIHIGLSDIDILSYEGWNERLEDNKLELELITSFQLVFTNFILKEWWPTRVNEMPIRDYRGEWTSEGIEVRAWEKWPGTKISEK